MLLKKCNIIICLGLLVFVGCGSESSTVSTDLKVQDCNQPLGVVDSPFKFSWTVDHGDSQTQAAVQIWVGEQADADEVFQSDFIENTAVFQYLEMDKLKSNTKYFWKVRTQSEEGNVSAWSEPSWFVTGILKPEEWQAQLIGGDSIQMIRNEFVISKQVAKAYANASSGGLYELRLNGEKVGDRVLDPVQTNTHKRLVYATYDVTQQLKAGKNVLGMYLSGGAYAHLYKSARRLGLVQLNIFYTDGTKQVIASNSDWRGTKKGPLTYTGLYEGENYDARLESDWDQPDFDDSKWEKCIEKEPAPLFPQLQAIKEMEEVKPVSVKKSPDGKAYIFDLGKNITGYPRIKVRGQAGTQITIRTSEILNDEGAINYWTAGREWKLKYTCKGDEEEVWKPRFTNTGFRYIELSGYPGTPTLDDVTGILIHSQLEHNGSFFCSDSLINKIQDAYILSQVGNLMGFPTDCPHRERLGWLGDALQIGISSSYNFDMQYFYKKWFRDMNDDIQPDGSIRQLIPFPNFGDEQDPVWQSASIIMPWELYWFYGDRGFLEDSYFRMERMMDFYASLAKDNIIEKNRWGDWVRPFSEESTNGAYLTTTYYFKCAEIMAHASEVLGKTPQKQNYRKLATQIRSAINQRWFNGEFYAEDTQTANAIALDFGIVDDANKQAVFERLLKDIEEREYHITAGVVGQMPVINSLQKFNRNDVIYKMVSQTTFPSLGFMLANGATTFWEKYHYGTGSYDSHNHVFLGGPYAKWFYAGLAGITPLEPGFKIIQIKPEIEVDMLQTEVQTGFGTIKCSWEKFAEKLVLHITVPSNTSANFVVPNLNDNKPDLYLTQSGNKILESNKFFGTNRIEQVASTEGPIILRLKPGTYHFEMNY